MRRAFRGFSLVELMVAMTLGTLLVAAAVQLLSTNQRTFQLQEGMSQVQEGGQFALQYLARDLRQVGYRVTASDPTILPPGILFGAGFSADSVDSNGNDRLEFQFYGTTDCEGDSVSPAALLTDTWYVSNGSLMCVGSANAATKGAALVGGVDSFQVLYGVDTKQDGVAFASEYQRADQLGANPVIVSVRVGLLLETQQKHLVQKQGTIQGFTVLDKVLTAGQAPLTDQAVRRLFETTVALRNVDPGLI